MRVGILGCGNMGGAIAQGVLRSGELRAAFPLLVYARNESARALWHNAGAGIATSATSLAQEVDVVLLAVKPYQVNAVLREITPVLTAKKIIICVAAGVSIAHLQKTSGNLCPVVRVMPNTLAAAGHGLFGVCYDDPALMPAHKALIQQLFEGLGTVVPLAEDKMNAFTALAGCGPAYVFYVADALIEAGVSMGLTRAAATSIAFSLLDGSAALAKQSAEHPAVLREQVTSPGGMTIAGINHLDRTAVRGAIVDAVLTAQQRGKEMEKSMLPD